MARDAKQQMIQFADWLFENALGMPDNQWQYQGVVYTTEEMVEIFLNTE